MGVGIKFTLMNTRMVQFAGNAIQFDVDHPGILAAVDEHFAHCFGVDETVLAKYQVRVEGEAVFSIVLNGEEFQSNLNFDQVLFHLMQDGLTKLNGAATTDLIFHSAALAYQDRGLLMCGKSGSGKSTLAAWLMSKGFHYLTDEVIAYPLTGERVSGFPRSLVLKGGSSAIWKPWLEGADSKDYIKMEDGSAWIAPTLLNPSAVVEEARPQLVLFPTYKVDADLDAEKLTPAGTLFNLLQCLVNARNFEDHGMAAVKQLSQTVSAYKLIYSDIEQAEEWIRTTLMQ